MARYARLLGWLALAAVAVAIGLLTESERTQVIAIQIFMLSALATSWNVLGGFAGQISLGHAVFFGLGSLVVRDLWLGGTPLAVAMLVAAAVASLAALIIGIPLLRLRGIYFAIGTLATGIGVWVTVGNVRPLISSLPLEQLRAFTYHTPYFVGLGVLALNLVVASWLRRSKRGLGMMAVRDDEGAAAATGVSAFWHKMSALVISAAMAALAGGVFAFSTVGYYPNYPFHVIWTFEAILVTFIGGLGTIAGPVIGSIFFVIGRTSLPHALTGFQPVVFGILFIIVVLALPGGIVEGSKRVFTWVSGTLTSRTSTTKTGEPNERK